MGAFQFVDPVRVGQVLGNNYSSSLNPSPSNDETQGYEAGSTWINTVTNEAFILMDATAGAALWVSTTAQSAGAATIVDLSFGLTGGVPGGGIRYLDHNGVSSSSAGIVLTDSSTLRGIAAHINTTVGVSQSYNLEVLSSPSTVPIVLATLTLAAGQDRNSRRDLAVMVGSLTPIGVRMVRTVGVGASAFTAGSVFIEVELP